MISKNEIKLQSEIKYFIRRYLKNFEYIYLTSDLRGFIFHYKIGPKEISQMINQRKPVYELQKNSSEAKDRSHTALKITGIENLPSYIQENKKKFEQWIIRN